jgi:putative ABC transport system permease protein
VLDDRRFALRQLIKTPGFTAVALLTLAVAIGVNAAVFSLVNGFVLRPIVLLRPAEVVSVYGRAVGGDYRRFSAEEVRALRDGPSRRWPRWRTPSSGWRERPRTAAAAASSP